MAAAGPGRWRSLLCAGALWLAGCGSVGDPLPPLVNIPERAQDFAGRQTAQGLVLEWTWPETTTEGMPLTDLESFEVHFMEVASPREPVSPERFESESLLLVSVEGADLERYGPGEKVSLTAPAQPHVGKTLALGVRAVNRRGRWIGFSNLEMVDVVPPPGPPRNVRSSVRAEGVLLEWEAAEGADGYRIYRASEEGEFTPVATAEKNSYLDRIGEFGRRYSYRVRSLGRSRTGLAEGPLSPVHTVFAEDRFPPAPPEGLEAVAAASSVELSWEENTEPDLAGYSVLRGEDGGKKVPLNQEPLRTPAFSDESAAPGRTYEYAVAAVDQNGNRSEPSAPVQIRVPAR